MPEHVLETIDPRVLGQRLQEARRARGLTQQNVAEALTVARTTITALEKGERRIRPDELVKLARLYGRAVSDLVGRREAVPDFAVQYRTAVAAVGVQKAQAGLEQHFQEFQRLCEDYLYLERLVGSPLTRTYPPQYSLEGVAPQEAADVGCLFFIHSGGRV